MKSNTLQSFLLLAIVVLSNSIFAQSTTKTKQAATTTKVVTAVKVVGINTEASNIKWIGKKILGQHNGQVKIQSGTLTVKNNAISGGEFTIDMKSITCDDLTDADYNKKLIGHLTSSDFFNVEAYPTATLKITKVLKNTKIANTYNLTANLTVKGITKSITFPATFKKVGNVFEGNAKITLDRTKWDIKYGSSSFFEGLGDKAIKNEIELNVNIASN